MKSNGLPPIAMEVLACIPGPGCDARITDIVADVFGCPCLGVKIPLTPIKKQRPAVRHALQQIERAYKADNQPGECIERQHDEDADPGEKISYSLSRTGYAWVRGLFAGS